MANKKIGLGLLVLGCIIVALSGCASTGVQKPVFDSFSGITKQEAILATDGTNYRWVRIQKASKDGVAAYMLFAKNNNADKRYLELNIDDDYIQVPESKVEFQVISSRYGVATLRTGSFEITKELYDKLVKATKITARYQQSSLVFENKIPIEQLREFLGSS
ncbi:MAG: hypothetical protein LBD79_07850 [Treponema sp.]|jgi:hypothetical protein|nr:hypothetical protein [Treponema sp.]